MSAVGRFFSFKKMSLVLFCFWSFCGWNFTVEVVQAAPPTHSHWGPGGIFFFWSFVSQSLKE